MMDSILSYFSGTKAVVMAIGALLIGGYIGKQKYDAYKAEKELEVIETKIAKTNVVIAKTKAESKAKAVKAETDVELEILRELKKESKKVQKEMQNIQKNIEVAKKEKGTKVTRTQKKKIKIEV